MFVSDEEGRERVSEKHESVLLWVLGKTVRITVPVYIF
jgi:hypothetical protein